MAVSLILNSPDVLIGGKRSESSSKGIEFILSCVQDDGGIYQAPGTMPGAGMPNYNTAICMTYAALLSFIYAQVDREDPGVQGAIDSIIRRWTLDENPGMVRRHPGELFCVLPAARAINGAIVVKCANLVFT